MLRGPTDRTRRRIGDRFSTVWRDKGFDQFSNSQPEGSGRVRCHILPALRRVLPLLLLPVLACLILAGCGSATAGKPSPPRIGPESLFQAPGLLLSDPAGALARMKAIGVDRVRVFV